MYFHHIIKAEKSRSFLVHTGIWDFPPLMFFQNQNKLHFAKKLHCFSYKFDKKLLEKLDIISFLNVN